jgi:23S rRNA (uracil1939-C5)-methyltransferase
MDKTVLVQIEKLVHGGKGLARDGALAIFIEGVLPGEEVRVQLGRVRKGYAEGRLLEILKPSPGRTVPPCAVYGRCGGCQLQHATATVQLELKRTILAETLARLGGLTDLVVPPLVSSPEAYGYRSRARLAVVIPRGKPASLAYFEEGSHKPVPIIGCPLLAPRLDEAVAHLNRVLAETQTMASLLQEVRLSLSVTTGEVVVRYTSERCTRGQAEAWFERARRGFVGLKGQMIVAGSGAQRRQWVDGETALSEQVGNLRIRCSERSFTQANWKLNAALVETVTAWALEGRRDSPLRVLELYAGIGNFGLPIARAGALVTFAEGNASALADARYNARVNHVGRCRFRAGPVEAVLAAAVSGEYDLALLDPPRSGLSTEAIIQLMRLKPGRIIYLSCDPPTLARDLRIMQDSGYRVIRLQGYDMFPQTMHIETLVELVR